MSTVQVVDDGAGQFRVVVEFSVEDCDRLPFNALMRVGAQLESLPRGGARANAGFDLRDPVSAGRFVETLAVFGQGGLFARDQHARPAEMEP